MNPITGTRALARRNSNGLLVLVCLGLIAIWALTGMGYFWPVWPILGWGIGVVSHRRSSRGRCTARSRRIGAARSKKPGCSIQPPWKQAAMPARQQPLTAATLA